MGAGRWYYHDEGASVGPVSWERLLGLFKAELIGASTLVWQEGTEGWKEFQSVHPTRASLPPPLPFQNSVPTGTSFAVAGDTADSQPELRIDRNDSRPSPTLDRASLAPTSSPVAAELTSRGSWVSHPAAPWRRYFARMFDVMINGLIAFTIFSVAFYAFAPISADGFFASLDGGSGETLTGLMMVLFAIPVTTLMLGLTGLTIGKWLFGVRVVTMAGRPIGLMKALLRELEVYIAGIGLGLPIVALFTMSFAYSRLKKSGFTKWDDGKDIAVLHRPMGILQAFLMAAGIVTYVGLIVCLSQL